MAAIPPGAEWHQKINDALNSSTFLIPIITPNFLESRWCNEEIFLFLEREKAIAAQFPELAGVKRIFPIDYIDITDVDAFNPQLLPELRKRQWIKFHDLRYKDPRDEAVLLRLDRIADSICKEVLRLDQRVTKQLKMAAEAQASAQQSAIHRHEEEEAAAAQKAAAEQQAEAERKARAAIAAQEAAALLRQQEQAARLAHEAEQAQRAAQEREAAQIVERRKREEEERSATTLRHAKEEASRKAQAEAEAEPRKSAKAHAATADTQTDTITTRADRYWPVFLRKRKRLVTIVSSTAGFLVVFFSFTHWGLPIIMYRARNHQDQKLLSMSVGVYRVLGLSRVPWTVQIDRKSCDAGETWDCLLLGDMYATGKDVPQDNIRAVAFYTQANALYRKACDGGSAVECDSLGVMYENGMGVAQDDIQAVALYRKACDRGYSDGCFALGDMYATGKGVPQDTTQAVTLYRKACDVDSSSACLNLGNMYRRGQGVAQDDTQAVVFYRKACDEGFNGIYLTPHEPPDALGCYNLGVMYENGMGVTKDNTQAIAFYQKACDGGDADGCNNLKRLQP